MQVFDDEFDYREIVNWQELTDMAVVLFVGLTALDTDSTGSGGGGSSNDDNWRDRKDEDEIERARSRSPTRQDPKIKPQKMILLPLINAE